MKTTGVLQQLLLLQAVALLLTLATAASPFQQTPAYVQAAFKLGQQQRTPLLSGSKWESLGPDRTTPEWAASWDATWLVDSGRVRAMLQDPERLNRVFVLFGGGGLWRTDNFYATPTGSPGDTQWKPLTDRIPNNGGAISFGCNSNVLYYAIGDFDSSLYPTNNPATSVSGVLVKSLDGGDTWQAPAIIGQYVSIIWDLDVIPGPAHDGSRDTLIIATDAGLFVSQDGGKAFKQVLPVNPKPPTWDLYNPTAITSVARTSAGWVAVGWLQPGGTTNTGVFLSEDGVHWDPTPVFRFPTTQRVTLAQAVHNDPRESVVFALVAASDGNDWVGIFRSNNGGRSFSALNVVLPTKTFAAPPGSATSSYVMDCMGGQSFYNHALLVDPSDRSRNTFIWAGAYASLKTTDNGETLTLTSAWYPARGWGCDGAEDVSYVHADTQAAIALKRPPGVTPKPHKGTTNKNRHLTPGGQSKQPVRAPSGFRTRQGLQKWLDKQQRVAQRHATGPRHSPPGAMVTSAGNPGRTAELSVARAGPINTPDNKDSQSVTLQHAVRREDQHRLGNRFPYTEEEKPHPHADYSPYQSRGYRESHRAPFDAPHSHYKAAYEQQWPVHEPNPHSGMYDRSSNHYNHPGGRYSPESYSDQPPYYHHQPYEGDGYPPYHYLQQPQDQEDDGAVYDILLGTDGGLFFSSDGGLSYDDGMLNIGLSTKLANYVVGTPLNRDMLVIGLQDNGSRLRIGTSTAWEVVAGGDGQSQFLSQAALNTSAAGYALIGNWYTFGYFLPFAQLDEAQRTGDASVLVGYQELNDDETLTSNAYDMDGTFGIPSPSVDPTGQVVFTRKGCCGLFMSTDAGLTWRVVYSFADKKEEEGGGGEEGDVRIDMFVASRFHNIAVAAGREEGTMSVAVIRPLDEYANTNEVEVTGVQSTTQGAGEVSATWSSESLETIGGWVDERLYLGATTTSPAWRDNTRVFVSSVALPSSELSPPRPRIAYADLTNAGLQQFTVCAAVGLPDTPVPRVVVEGNYILAATWHGVYASTDDCATFAQLGSSLPNVQVRDLYVLPADGQQPRMLLAATYGRGVWRLPLP